ncbi:MAG TPA: family 20 glycosylhydrolase, partial [Vicinamibacteria bacterium]|nr:family 20 glycosylhydrolase [Vicinamibacteria bacterium]
MRAGAAFLAAIMSSPALAAAPGPGTHDLMPAPASLEWRTGRLDLRGAVRLASTGAADPRVGAALERAARRLSRLSGVRATAVGRAEGAAVVVSAAAASAPIPQLGEDESYTLEVDARQARIAAPTTRGALHGLETLLQLAREEQGRAHVPAVRIEDRPRFPWRGLMIDPCRRWQPVEVVRRTLDAMAAVKMNVLHWHLSEDQGFRIESRVYPLLHQKASDGLFYTQEQAKEVIAYAAERGIRVVPEFDVPGHSTSWLVAYPELGSAPGPFELERRWGIFDNNLDPSKDEVYAFLDRFFGEMAALFPDPYFHIGGDEVTPRQWNANDRILDYMYRNRLGDMHDLQAHFNGRVNASLGKQGKRMVGWDEILDPALPKDIVIHSWR